MADEDYIRESILNPRRQIVEGYQPIMPTFKGQVTEEQLDAPGRVYQIVERRYGNFGHGAESGCGNDLKPGGQFGGG